MKRITGRWLFTVEEQWYTAIGEGDDVWSYAVTEIGTPTFFIQLFGDVTVDETIRDTKYLGFISHKYIDDTITFWSSLYDV